VNGVPERHYSYAHYADRQVAEGFDALRFGGPIGQYLLDTQERILLDALRGSGGRAVLDVGTGTGRAALALATAGASVIGVDASAEMLDVARRRASEAGAVVRFDVADAHALPFGDREFDLVVSLRLLMHVPDWRRCIAELARVSRHSVMIDFPAALSLAAIQSGARRLLAIAGRRTEPYRLLAEAAVEAELRSHGLRVTRVERQFVLPIALHKRVGSLGFTRGSERTLAAIGLRRLLGSPVTMVAER
jgi:ubiquinone/menaquinone biosynthesis C-methylase UbiE